MTFRRTGLLVAAGLLAFAGSACTGSDSEAGGVREQAPSTTEFCGALTDFQAGLAAADPGDPAAYVQGLKAAATRLAAVGVPEAMPTEARSGLTTRIAAITGLPQAPTSADLGALDTVAKDPAVVALDGYVSTTCPTL